MARVIHSVSISPELSEEMKKQHIRPSDAFKRGVMLYLKEKTLTKEDNPLILKEKIAKMTQIIQEQAEEYALLKEQYERVAKDD